MAGYRPSLAVAEQVAAAATLVVGWLAVLDQVVRDGFLSGGGTVWLVAFAAAATAGAWTLWAAPGPGQHGLRAVGLALTALSPTGFGYIVNIVVLVFAATELALAIPSKRRPRQLSSTT